MSWRLMPRLIGLAGQIVALFNSQAQVNADGQGRVDSVIRNQIDQVQQGQP